MLKASFEVIKPGITNSFLVREFKARKFDAPFHFCRCQTQPANRL